MPRPDFTAMQEQMFDQFHQTMITMFEGFAALHRETSASIRAEFDEVRKLNAEIEVLRKSNRLAEAVELAGRRNDLWARVLESMTTRP